MKLKSLKLALRLLNICLKQHKSIVGSNEEYDEGIEVYKDIEGCIKVIDRAFRKEAKKLVRADTEGIGWSFPITVDVEYGIEYLKKNMKRK